MKKLRYTEGPWRVLPEEVDKQYIRIRGTVPGSRYKIANVICPSDSCGEADETRANSRLIAAAPELLDALERLVLEVEAGVINPEDKYANDSLIKAKNAIKAATNG